MELSGYEAEALHEDQEFILYRGHSKKVEAPSVLLLATVALRPPLETLKKLEHEYSIRNDLDTTWAVRPIALSQYNERSVLVFEDPGGEPLNKLIHGRMGYRRDLLDHIIAINERHLKRMLCEYVSYHHEDRTHLGLGKGTPWCRTRCVTLVACFPKIDWAGCTTVMIGRPSPTAFPSILIYRFVNP